MLRKQKVHGQANGGKEETIGRTSKIRMKTKDKKREESYRLVLRDLYKCYGKERCEQFVWGCPNCFGYLLIDLLEEHIDTQWLQNEVD